MKRARLASCIIAIIFITALSAIDLRIISAAAPTVTTLPATDITSTSAKLGMSVNSNGKATVVWFTPCQGMGGDSFTPTGHSVIGITSGAHIITIPITSLKPSTSYSYKAMAQNSDGTSSGGCLMFTTSSTGIYTPLTIGPISTFAILSLKPTVAVLQPTNITTTSATLRGTINPNNSQTTYSFISCDKQGDPLFASFPSSPPATLMGTQALTVTHTINVIHSKNYSYKIVATNAAGTTTSSCQDFSTPPGTPSLPPAISLSPTLSPPAQTNPSLPLQTIPPTQTTPPPQTTSPSPSTSGALTIVSNASSYTIYVNGVLMAADNGSGTTTIYLVPGQYNILLQKNGCFPASLSTSVPQGISQVQIPMTCQDQTTLPPTLPATQAAPSETIPTTIPPSSSYRIDYNTLLFAGLGLVAVLLIALIVAMMSRGSKKPPKIYSSR